MSTERTARAATPIALRITRLFRAAAGAARNRPAPAPPRNLACLVIAAALALFGPATAHACDIQASQPGVLIAAGTNGAGPGGWWGWTVTWNPTDSGNQVQVEWKGLTVNQLTKMVTWNNLNSVTLTFQERPRQPATIPPQGPAQDSPVTGGLNILMRECITNSSGSNWSGFTMELEDLTPVVPPPADGGPTAAHPIAPHFHPGAVAPSFLPFTRTTTMTGGQGAPTTIGQAINAQTQFTLTGGTLNNGAAEVEWTNFRIHDREQANMLRAFRLVETPIAANPEPSSLALAGVGILALFGSRKLAERRRRREPG